MYVCMYACMTNATAVRRLFLVASRPMLIPFEHRHLVTFLQCNCSAMSATPATQNDGRCEFVPRLPRKMTVDVSFATPATQNEGGCEVVPRLPRKVPRRHGRHGRPSQSKHGTQCHECHACHAKRWWMFDCDTVAVRLCHACHAKRRWM